MDENAPSITENAPVPGGETLTPIERRILGVLVEKQRTSKTAEAYPLTLNALVTACNQKSNRDPVMDLTEAEVSEALPPLQRRGLVMRIAGGRADRYRHELTPKWTDSAAELAILAELLLRGPQTKGDLRGRAARMAPLNALESLEALEALLQPMIARGQVVFLTDPERRGAVLTHGFHPPDELKRLQAHHSHASATVSAPEVSAAHVASSDAKLAEALAEIEALKLRLDAVEWQLAELRRQLDLPAV